MASMPATQSTASYSVAARLEGLRHQTLLRIGGWLGVTGGLLALIANGLHPHPSDFNLEALLQQIAQSPAWPVVHLALLFGLLLILAAMAAITLTIQAEPGATVARFACIFALLGGTLILVSTSMDGFAMNQLAHSWLSAPAGEKPAALRVAEGFEAAQYAVYSLSVVTFLGIGIALYGLATLLGTAYPKVLGWLAMLSGTGTLVVGVFQLFGGPAQRGTEIFFVLFSIISTAWIIVMSVQMLRMARQAEASLGGAPAPAAAPVSGPSRERRGRR